MKVAITCEYSGIVRDAFIERGHNAISCDLLPSESNKGPHHQGDMFELMALEEYDFIGCHYTCTYMANSGVRWLFNPDGSKNIERWIQLENAVNTFNKAMALIKVGYMENPIPHKYARDGFHSVVTGDFVKGIGTYTQTIQPYEFGHTTTKRTCLWLKGLPALQATQIIPKELRTQDIWIASPGPNRWKERSRTFTGIAKAMSAQWG